MHVTGPETWVSLLADALGAELDLLAAAGSRVRDVRIDQLPIAVARRAVLASVLIGLNDVNQMSATAFDASAIRADLLAIVAELRAAGLPVLLARLHDPTEQFWLPDRLRRHYAGRVAAVNAVIDSVRGHGVFVWDLADVAQLRCRGAWAVDRLHPSVDGHRAMAVAAAAVLRANGFAVVVPVSPSVSSPATGRWDEARWLARHGTPYVAGRAGKWVAAALASSIGVGRGSSDPLGQPGFCGRVPSGQ